MKKKMILSLSCIIIFSLLFLSQCKKQEKIVNIGVILPLTGPYANLGESSKHGIELALSKINTERVKNGKGRINVLFEDSQGAILGPNGSGKTTLLRSLVGIMDAFNGYIKNGEIKREGISIIRKKPYELFRTGIAFVPDGGKVFPGMTVRENLEMGGYIMDDKGELEVRIEKVLKTFPILEPLLKRIAGSLSGGERQILSLARSLITEPEFLIFDEPTAGLSPNYVKIFFKKLQILKQDIGILMVEQNAKLALQYVDRGYVMRNGQFTFEGSSADLLNEEDVFKLL